MTKNAIIKLLQRYYTSMNILKNNEKEINFLLQLILEKDIYLKAKTLSDMPKQPYLPHDTMTTLVSNLINYNKKIEELNRQNMEIINLRIKMKNILNRLPGKVQIIFDCRYNRDLTLNEISKKTKLSESKLEYQIRKGLEFLIEEYK